MNYTELLAAVRGYAENEFPSTVGGFTSDAQLSTFIRNAEQRIYNTVQLPSLRKNVTGALTAGIKYLSLPGDFLSVFSLAVVAPDGAYQYLLNKDVNFLREAYPSPADQGLPEYYAVFGPTTTSTPPVNPTNELSAMLGPTPDSDYAVELHYFYYPLSITDTTDNPEGRTWLGDNAEMALLYGALLEAAAFMHAEEDVIKNYTFRYTEAMALLKQLGDGKLRQDAYRSGQTRMPVV